MSAPSFTPGPWDWHDQDDKVFVTADPYRRYVCEALLPSDARLIAAAPKLYEALDQMLLSFGGDIKAYDNGLYHRAYDALAQARGETA